MPKRARSLGGGSSPSSSPGGSPDASDADGADDEDVPYVEPEPANQMDPLFQRTPEEEDDGEDLIGDGMEADYRPMGALDDYEEDGLDNADYGAMDFGARAAADAALEARDARERTSRMPKALLTSDDDDADERAPRRRRRDRDADGGYAGDPHEAEEARVNADFDDMLGDEEEAVHVNLEDYNVPLTEWLEQLPVADEVRRRFRRFLSGIHTHAGAIYADRVRATPCAARCGERT